MSKHTPISLHRHNFKNEHKVLLNTAQLLWAHELFFIQHPHNSYKIEKRKARKNMVYVAITNLHLHHHPSYIDWKVKLKKKEISEIVLCYRYRSRVSHCKHPTMPYFIHDMPCIIHAYELNMNKMKNKQVKLHCKSITEVTNWNTTWPSPYSIIHPMQLTLNSHLSHDFHHSSYLACHSHTNHQNSL